MNPSTAARVEDACLNGWPSLASVLLDGWLLRFAEGYTRRANSVSVIGPSRSGGTRDFDARIRACEALYAAQDLPTVFRLSSAVAHGDLARALDAARYGAPEDETLVLIAGIPPRSGVEGAGARLAEGAPSLAWLAALARISGQDARTAALHAGILAALAVPCAFAAIEAGDGTVGSVAFGAVSDGIVCVNSVATAPEHRGRGLAGRAVGAVLAWGEARAGAQVACLPVGAANAPALAVYRRLGFATEASRYHYRTVRRD